MFWYLFDAKVNDHQNSVMTRVSFKNLHRLHRNPADILDNIIEMVAESGSGPHGFMRLWLAQNPYIFAFHPDTVEPVLNGSKHM